MKRLKIRNKINSALSATFNFKYNCGDSTTDCCSPKFHYIGSIGSGMETIIRYATSDRVKPRLLWALERVPNWVQVPIPVGHRQVMWLRLLPEDLRYAIPDKEGGVKDAILDRLESGDCFIELGAHLGYYSLLAAASVCPSGSVIAFEPHPTHASRLNRNVRWNRRAVEIEQAAVSDTDGMAELSVSDRGGGHALGSGDRGVTVETIAFDSYREQTGVQPDMVKVDVEGADVRALDGMEKTLRECKPAIVCELHPNRIESFGDTIDGFYSCLAEHGYRIEELPSENELTQNQFVRKACEGSVNDFGMDTHLHIVAEPT
jgi:FkbM family methyltransferase